jgi:Tol biopolymer transport system component
MITRKGRNVGAGGSTVSPDGTQVAFLSFRNADGTDSPNPNGTWNIWRMKPDGSSLIPLTNKGPGEVIDNVQWSPQGTQIAFQLMVSTGSTLTTDIWRVRPDGTGLIPLTATRPDNFTLGGFQDVGTLWSPGGTRLIFLSNGAIDGVPAPLNIWRANSDGSGVAPVTRMMHSSATRLRVRP